MNTTASAPALRGLARAMDHVALPVFDLEQAERFYVDVLGAELLARFDAQSFVQQRPERAAELDKARYSPLHVSVRIGAGPRLDLFLQDHGQPALEQPHPHIAFEVDGAQLDTVKALLASAGVPVDGPRRLGPPGQASLYLLDPSGNKLEFTSHRYPGEAPVGVPDWAALARASGR